MILPYASIEFCAPSYCLDTHGASTVTVRRSEVTSLSHPGIDLFPVFLEFQGREILENQLCAFSNLSLSLGYCRCKSRYSSWLPVIGLSVCHSTFHISYLS